VRSRRTPVLTASCAVVDSVAVCNTGVTQGAGRAAPPLLTAWGAVKGSEAVHNRPGGAGCGRAGAPR